MVYKLEKNNPYNKKKVSLGKKIRSGFITLLACGMLITLAGRFGNLYLISKNTEQYTTTISYYDELIHVVASYMKEHSGDNPENCFKLYTQLLWNGYFSANRKYEYNVEDQNNIVGYYGVRIATGQGDCKNNEDFFYRIMKELGYHVYQVACSQNAVSPKDILFGNHVITVVEYKGVEYYFDTTNACTYQKVGVNQATNEAKDLTIWLKPWISYVYGYNNEEETIYLIGKSLDTTSEKAFTVKKEINYVNNKKILLLRKAIEPQLQAICSTIVSEG